METFLPLQVFLLHCSEGQQRKLHQHFKHAALQSTNTMRETFSRFQKPVAFSILRQFSVPEPVFELCP